MNRVEEIIEHVVEIIDKHCTELRIGEIYAYQNSNEARVCLCIIDENGTTYDWELTR